MMTGGTHILGNAHMLVVHPMSLSSFLPLLWQGSPEEPKTTETAENEDGTIHEQFGGFKFCGICSALCSHISRDDQ